jgi:hypothetical protein
MREILRLMKREKYDFMATLEMERPIPEGADVMTELAKSSSTAPMRWRSFPPTTGSGDDVTLLVELKQVGGYSLVLLGA